jgi:hypothetical protein
MPWFSDIFFEKLSLDQFSHFGEKEKCLITKTYLNACCRLDDHRSSFLYLFYFYLFFAVLGLVSRTSDMPGKAHPREPHPSPKKQILR